jgi:probable rRNA maturation factor
MDPGSSTGPAPRSAGAGIEVIVADPAWRRFMRRPEALARRAALLAGVPVTVVLSSDRHVKQLNARHRGRNKPTNVLTFEPAGPRAPGDVVLALGTIRREAKAAGKHPAHHLAHLVVHGALHLQGHDHHSAGEARRMEMTETWLLRRLGVPNPWRGA